jgi:hypothetical protein
MISKSLVDLFNSSVDLNQKSLTISLLAIAFNPTAWNIVARNGAGPICLVSSTWMRFVDNFLTCVNARLTHKQQNTGTKLSRDFLEGIHVMDVISSP